MKLMLMISSIFRIFKFVEVTFMKKFRRKNLALALACASVLSCKAKAMNTKPQSRQTLAQVGKSKSMSNLTKGLIAGGIVLGATEFLNEGLGIFTKADTWYKGKFSIANGIRQLCKKQVKPDERQALVDKILDVLNTFETEESIKNGGNFKKKKGKAKAKIIEYRKSKGEFDRINIEAFERDDDPPTDESPEAGQEKIENSRKRSIIVNLDSRRQLLNKVKAGENLVGVKLAFPDNGIRFTYNGGDYVAFEVKSDGSLYVDYKNDGIKFKCTLNKPK